MRSWAPRRRHSTTSPDAALPLTSAPTRSTASRRASSAKVRVARRGRDLTNDPSSAPISCRLGAGRGERRLRRNAADHGCARPAGRPRAAAPPAVLTSRSRVRSWRREHQGLSPALAWSSASSASAGALSGTTCCRFCLICDARLGPGAALRSNWCHVALRRLAEPAAGEQQEPDQRHRGALGVRVQRRGKSDGRDRDEPPGPGERRRVDEIPGAAASGSDLDGKAAELAIADFLGARGGERESLHGASVRRRLARDGMGFSVVTRFLSGYERRLTSSGRPEMSFDDSRASTKFALKLIAWRGKAPNSWRWCGTAETDLSSVGDERAEAQQADDGAIIGAQLRLSGRSRSAPRWRS